jgi:hypothetical protein
MTGRSHALLFDLVKKTQKIQLPRSTRPDFCAFTMRDMREVSEATPEKARKSALFADRKLGHNVSQE